MYLYKINYSFIPFSKVKYFYRKKKNFIVLYFCLLQVDFIILRIFLNCFFFILNNCFFFNLLVNEPWKIYSKFIELKSYTSWFYMLRKGRYCRNKVRIQVLGLGNRIIEDTWKSHIISQRLYVKLGHAHLIFFQKTDSMRFKKHKRKHTLTIYSTNKFLLSNFIYIIRRFRGPNCYTGNGVKFLREKLKYKPRKKWGVF